MLYPDTSSSFGGRSECKGLSRLLEVLISRKREPSALMDRKVVKLPPSLTLPRQLLLALVAGVSGAALAAPLTAAALAVHGVLLPHEELSIPGSLSPQVATPSSITLTSTWQCHTIQSIYIFLLLERKLLMNIAGATFTSDPPPLHLH